MRDNMKLFKSHGLKGKINFLAYPLEDTVKYFDTVMFSSCTV